MTRCSGNRQWLIDLLSDADDLLSKNRPTEFREEIALLDDMLVELTRTRDAIASIFEIAVDRDQCSEDDKRWALNEIAKLCEVTIGHCAGLSGDGI